MNEVMETPGDELPWSAYTRLGATYFLVGGAAVIRGGITVKPHALRFATDLEKELGVSNFGTYNGHSPPEGPTQALDIFTPDTQNGYMLQDDICAFIIRNQAKYGVRYCIRRTKIWNVERASEGWRQQTVYGNRTSDHYDHVHVTFYASAEEVKDEPMPDKPIDKEIEDMAVTWFRYIYDGQDYVVDRISRTFSLTTDLDQLKELDALGCVERGKKGKAVHDYWKGLYGG